MKNICMVNGSLRGKKASSLVFLDCISRGLAQTEFRKETINVRANPKQATPEDQLRTLTQADAVIMVFPLFTYGVPGALMRLLEDWLQYADDRGHKEGTRVYIVANCGFPRPEIMSELIRVMKNFCRRSSLHWRFAVCLGGGPVAATATRLPVLRRKYAKAFSSIAADIRMEDMGQGQDRFIKPFLPEPVMLWIKARYERKMKAAATGS